MDTLPTLYMHPARADWGHGLVVSLEDGRPRLAFEDGKTRLLQSLDVLERATLSEDETRRVVDALVAKPKAKAAKPKATKLSKAGTRFASFEAQVERFLQIFPKGFEDPRYVAEERQAPNAKGTLRHRAGAMAYAAEMLSPDAITADLAADPSEVHRKACRAIGRSTNLLFTIDAVRFNGLASEHHAAFATALRALLAHGGSAEDAIDAHFDRYVDALAVTPRASWAMATLHPALVQPDRFVLVQPKYLAWQAALFAMETPTPGLPTASGFRVALAIAREVDRRLRAVGLTPRDLMNVQVFINRTHRSKNPDSQ